MVEAGRIERPSVSLHPTILPLDDASLLSSIDNGTAASLTLSEPCRIQSTVIPLLHVVPLVMLKETMAIWTAVHMSGFIWWTIEDGLVASYTRRIVPSKSHDGKANALRTLWMMDPTSRRVMDSCCHHVLSPPTKYSRYRSCLTVGMVVFVSVHKSTRYSISRLDIKGASALIKVCSGFNRPLTSSSLA